MVSNLSPLFLEKHKHVQCTEVGPIIRCGLTTAEWAERGNDLSSLVLGIKNTIIWLKSTLVLLLACLMVRPFALYFLQAKGLHFCLCVRRLVNTWSSLSWSYLWSEKVQVWVPETGLKGARVRTRRGQSRGNKILMAEGSLWPRTKGHSPSARAKEWSKSSGGEVTDWVKKWISCDLGQEGARLGSF